MKTRYLVFALASAIFLILLIPKSFNHLEASIPSADVFLKKSDFFKQTLNINTFEDLSLSQLMNYDGKNYQLNYTIDFDFEKKIERMIKRYSPDYASVVVIDNNSGALIAALDYSKKNKNFGRRLTFSSNHPAASLFKIVSSAELIENTTVGKYTSFEFVGKSTTLYNYQLKEINKKNKRWVRRQNLRDAFAASNNVIFAKAAIEHLVPSGLYKMALDMGFNESLMFDAQLEKSNVYIPENNFEFAELSSGFNKITSISPIHAALLASIVANNGKLLFPHIVSSVVEDESGKEIYSVKNQERVIFSSETSDVLKDLMNATITKGTAKRAFRPHKRKDRILFNSLELGGKTGSITGGEPFGKRDWFVLYAIPKEDKNDNGISISVMLVNKKKWVVKSSQLASDIIKEYYRNKI